MQGLEAQGPHHPVAHRLAAALIPLQHVRLLQRIIDITLAPDPRGGSAVIRDRVMNVEAVKKGVLPDGLEDGEQILYGAGALDHSLAQELVGHHAKELLGNLEVDPVGPLKPQLLDQGRMPERIMQPPELSQGIN